VGATLETFLLNEEQYIMVTTGELRAIIQELHLVDLGDAASYLGEEAQVAEELEVPVQSTLVLVSTSSIQPTCEDLSCQLASA
jgi:hypothetical protein